MMAAYGGQLGAIQVLRERGASFEHRDKGGSSALHWAVDGQNVELIEWMLENGADVNIRDTVSHWTPLLRCGKISTRALHVEPSDCILAFVAQLGFACFCFNSKLIHLLSVLAVRLSSNTVWID